MTLFDAGLQPERTELAWRRTSLAIGVGSLVALRLLPVALDAPGWAFVGLAGLLAAAILFLASRRRARAVNVALRDAGDRAALPGGALLGALALLVTLAGAAGVSLVLGLALA